MNDEWNLHYFGWVIGDGEPDRRVGEVFDWFAISFWSETQLTRTAETTKAAVPVAGNFYRVCAEVVYISKTPGHSACVLDFGITAVADGVDLLPHDCEEGEYVSGEVMLELPLCSAQTPHNVGRRWRVNRISADVTPLISVPNPTGGYLKRDPSRIRYQDVIGTDSVRAEVYILHCSDLGLR